jgi:hypothetical protein
LDCWREVTAVTTAGTVNQKQNRLGGYFTPDVALAFPVLAVSGLIMLSLPVTVAVS